MKAGDSIMIDGVLPAFVRAICTPAQLRARLPRFRPAAEAEAQSSVRAAVITFDAGTPDGKLEIGVILEASTGGETIGGDPLTIARIEWRPL